MQRVVFYDLRLSLPSPWCDITDDLPPGSPPTLARGADGSGVLQFSIARYKEGVQPNISSAKLLELLEEFEATHDLHRKSSALEENTSCLLVKADFSKDSDFLRAYYVSDGQSICLITYLCDAASKGLQIELGEADQIVRSVEFS